MKKNSRSVIGYILGGAGLAGLAASAGFFSYSAQRLLNPFSAANTLQTGLPQTLKNFERTLESNAGLYCLLALLGGWLIFSYSKPDKAGAATNLVAESSFGQKWANWLALGLLVCGLAVRLVPLFAANWLQMETDYDEGVHLMAARLFTDGARPYRDYFFAQPPGVIYWLSPVSWLSGNTLDFIWLSRFFWIIGWAGGSGWLAWLIGKRLGGISAGLLALLALQLDGLGVFVGHQIMLEWPVNFFSLLAVWAILKQFEQAPATHGRAWFKPEKWLLLAGIAIGLTIVTKLSGGLIGLALGIYLLFWRRFSWLAQLIVISVATSLVLFLPVLLQSGLAGLRQFLFFQLLREPDGIGRADRFSSFTLDARPYGVEAGSNFSILLVVMGAAGWLWLAWRKEIPRYSGLIAIWASLTLFFFYYNSTFFVHYYVNLIPPMALATTGLSGWFKRLNVTRLGISLLVGLLLLPAAVTQFSTLLAPGLSTAPKYFGDFIRQVTAPSTTVQSFDMIYNLVAGRKLPASNGRYLIDSYGALQYEAYELSDKGLSELLGMVAKGQKISANREQVVGSPQAQTFLQQLFGAAGFVILDERGRDYVAGDTETTLKTYSVQLVTNKILVAYASQLHSSRQVARQWLAANLPRGAKIWVEPGTLYLPGEFQSVAGTNTWQHPPEWYAQQGFAYLLLSSESYGRFFENQEKTGEAATGYRQLIANGHLATFRPGSPTSQPAALAAEAERLDLVALPGAPPLLNLTWEESGATFESGLRLESTTLQRRAKAGSTLAFSLNWQVLQSATEQPVKLFVHLLDKTGNTVAQRDTLLAVGNWPLKYWFSGSPILTEADLGLPTNLAPGSYRVEIGLYYETSGNRLSVKNRQGVSEASLLVGTLEIL